MGNHNSYSDSLDTLDPEEVTKTETIWNASVNLHDS